MKVLALDVAGTPRFWVSEKEAILYHAKNLVVWSLGDTVASFHGGYRRLDNVQSVIETPSIIAVRGPNFDISKFGRVGLSNEALFGRDRYMCAYCGTVHKNGRNLSRDHIMPKARGGKDDWMNVVTACRICNSHKGHKTLKEAKLELLYVPYVPNHFEALLLMGHNILKDQMDYLLAGIPKHSRVLLN